MTINSILDNAFARDSRPCRRVSLALCLLAFAVFGGEVELKRGDKTIERAEASPRRGDFEGAMRKITNALSDYLKLSK